jgi:hypothetical protein
MMTIMATTTPTSLLRLLQRNNLPGQQTLKIKEGGMHIPPFLCSCVWKAELAYATEAARSVMACRMSGGPKDEVPQTKRLAPCCFAMGAVLV